MNRYYLLFLSIVLFSVSCQQRVWDNPYDPDSNIDRSILIFPIEKTIDINEEILLDIQFNMSIASLFAVSMVIDYDSTMIQPLNFVNGEVFGTENISFFNVKDSKIFLTISFLQGDNPDYRSGLLCSFNFVGIGIGLSNIQIALDDLYLFDPNGNEIPYDDLFIGSTTITVK
jgi:hypothetical protein